ncbi:MAG: hypothetical protein JSS72_04040 [Armatimonadetes bacterium]|nr:hypothetical protein [Armatimonadota bacterium]
MSPKQLLCAMTILAAGCSSIGEDRRVQTYPLDSLKDLKLIAMTGKVETFKGKTAVRIGNHTFDLGHLAVVNGAHLRNGTIDVDIASQPNPGAPIGVDGFAGVFFRAVNDENVFGGFSSYEYFYLRATDGRAKDKETAGHVVQYASFPKFPWFWLRQQWPGKYEAHANGVDVAVWTHMKIQIHERQAKFFVGDMKEPCLVVNDLKQEPTDGPVGFWVGTDSEAWFANLVITPE